MTTSRVQGLDDAAIQRVVATAQALDIGRVNRAEALLRPVLRIYPDHPEILRLYAGILSLRRNYVAAIETMRRALALRRGDALYYNTFGTVLGDSGDFDGAIRALRRACELQPNLAIAWFNLGSMLTKCVRTEEAAEVLRHAVRLAPDNLNARILLANMLRMRGDTSASAAEYRKVLADRPYLGDAWWGLADLRTGELKREDVRRLEVAFESNEASDGDRIATGFALAKALDEQGYYRKSLKALKGANTIARRRVRWDASAFSRLVDTFNSAFTPPSTSAWSTSLGGETIFIVGMPRSGTTLVEQILASHSRVEGAGELPDLSLVLAEESRRRGQPFPSWVADMRPDDWQRAGERYLERTAHWRRRRPVFTDKLPNNWMYIGAIRAMLPGARVIICRRDPLETCFSCYRQRLPSNDYTRTPADLAAFWHDFDRSAVRWAKLHPSRVYEHSYEELVAYPERTTKRLLAACDLPFERACLGFHKTDREIRSPSATQVRRPLQPDTARARNYGELLDPLRKCLSRVGGLAAVK